MLVALPMGLWTFSLIADLLARATDNPTWSAVAFYTLGGGIVGALVAAVPGLIDLAGMRDPQAKRLGVWHMVINLAAVGVFATNFFLRWNDPEGPMSFALSVLGIALIGFSGWLGGEMVYVHGVGVTPPDRRPEGRSDPVFTPAQSTKHQAR
jgi:uncharacterized membrane protein